MHYKKSRLGILRKAGFKEMRTKNQFDASFHAKYGRDYTESSDAIHDVMSPRIRRIIRYLGNTHPVTLVDIGTAYGTFLTLLPGQWRGLGLEKLRDIADYANTKLGRPVYNGDAATFRHPCDVVTMWHVIEHIPDLFAALANIRENLLPGGLLCIATPNAHGGYFRFRRKEYEAQDDPSHVWIFSPGLLRQILKENGFEVLETVITGHHPERWGGAMWLSKLFRLGDTFEIYARKTS